MIFIEVNMPSDMVELRRLEPLVPCLQIGFSACGQGADLDGGLSVSDRGVPLMTGANGLSMVRV